MTTLHERLQDVIAEMRDDAERHAEKFADLSPRRVLAWANAIEAATALQGSGGEVVAETMISHAREPHCIGCYVIRWNDGELVAQCNECGATVALLDGLASPAQPSGFVLVPVEPTEEMIEAAATAPLQSMQKQRQRLSLGEILKIEYAAMLYAAPSPTAALQAGEA